MKQALLEMAAQFTPILNNSNISRQASMKWRKLQRGPPTTRQRTIDGVEVGSLRGFEGKKGKGESDAILFYLKMYLYIRI